MKSAWGIAVIAVCVGGCGLEGVADAVEVSAGDEYACALRQNGGVSCWGHNGYGELGDGTEEPTEALVEVRGVVDAVGLSAGDAQACAVRRTGEVSCWGRGRDGERGGGAWDDGGPTQVLTLHDAVAVSCGTGFCCALRASGAVACWGANGAGQLGASSGLHRGRAASAVPMTVEGVSDAVRISAGKERACATLGSGESVCWGAL